MATQQQIRGAAAPATAPAQTTYGNAVPGKSSKQLTEQPPIEVIINVPGNLPTVSESKTSDVLNGIAAILWPIVILILLLVFKKHIIDLAHRLRTGKLFGAEAEFDKSELKDLQTEALKAADEVPPGDLRPHGAEAFPDSDTDRVRAQVLTEASRSPQLALMLLSSLMDRLARRLAAKSGHLQATSVRDQLEVWSSQMPSHTAHAYRLFSGIRNQIVHGSSASDEDILSAIDSGLTIYAALAALPLERNVVAHTDVPIFADSAATIPAGGHAVVLECEHNGKMTFRIYPTTQTHFQRGMEVTWEWNMGRIWGPAWYRDPDTNEVKQAWSSSAEFIGRDLASI